MKVLIGTNNKAKIKKYSTILNELQIEYCTPEDLKLNMDIAETGTTPEENSKIKGDASVAMISVGSLAAGYFLMNIFSPSTNLSGDVCSTLFGSTLILTLTKTDMILSVVISALVIIFFVIFYNRIFAITFDEN